MRRRDFIKMSLAGGLLFPSFHPDKQDFEFDEIIGKKRPDLFGGTKKLRKQPFEALNDLRSDARKEGIDILLVSAYRSFDDQRRIWNRKYNEFTAGGMKPEEAVSKIIEYSTIPGTSRHHWGTDIDIIDANPKITGDRLLAKYFLPDEPYGKLKSWLNTKAGNYGFFEVYTNKPGRKGFRYEPWHFSFASLSRPILKAYTQIDFFSLLKGLSIHGSDRFSHNFINTYWKENMLDINPALVPG